MELHGDSVGNIISFPENEICFEDASVLAQNMEGHLL